MSEFDVIDKDLLKDKMGHPLTQRLILELEYHDDAIYTLKREDHEHKGKVHISLVDRYLKMNDPTEYLFATTYFLSPDHWDRVVKNSRMTPYVESWRRELELKLRCLGVQQQVQQAHKGNANASRWLAERGWNKKVGRPSKEDVQRQADFAAQALNEYGADLERLREH